MDDHIKMNEHIKMNGYNDKDRMREYCQRQKWELPVYKTKKVEGNDHCPYFISKVFINGGWYGGDKQPTKELAEINAADTATYDYPDCY